jgi:hypothetical protein
MGGGSGDLVACYGSLYALQGNSASGRSFSDAVRAAQEGPHGPLGARWTIPMPTVVDGYMPGAAPPVDIIAEEMRAAAQPLPIAVNSEGGRMLVSNEGDDAAAGRWMDSSAVPDARSSSPQAEEEWNDLGHAPSPAGRTLAPTAQQPLPLSPAAPSQLSAAPAIAAPSTPEPAAAPSWRQLFSAASLKIVRDASRSTYELQITDLGFSSSDQLVRPASSTLKFSLDASLCFRSSNLALLSLPEDALAQMRGANAAPVEALFAFEERVANSLQTRYAFLLHSLDPATATPRGMDAALPARASSPLERDRDAMSPLELAYCARLSMYENMHADARSSLAMQSKRSVNLGNFSTVPLSHTKASDEELWLLLAGVHIHSAAD